MALTVTVPATTTDLTTVARLQQELSDLDDPEASDLIAEASDVIVRHCGRSFARETYKETVPGFGSTDLMLSRTPIVGTPTVLHNSEPITDFTVEDPGAGILRRSSGWIWTAGVGWSLTSYVVPGSEEPKFVVTYDAGYILPDDAENRDLPGGIERACIDLVRAFWTARDRDPDITQRRLGDFAVSYASPDERGGLPPRVEALLAPWVRWN